MDRHTLKAATLTVGLYSIAVPLLLATVAISGGFSAWGPALGMGIYLASAYIFWSWLVVDAPRSSLPRSTAIIALLAYVLLFVLAVVGYLFYSRGLVRGFGAFMWFVLLVFGAIVGFMVVGEIFTAISSVVPLKR